MSERVQNRLALLGRTLRLLLAARAVALHLQSALGLHLRDVQGAHGQAVRLLHILSDVLVRRLRLGLIQSHVLRADGHGDESLRCGFPR